MIDLLNSDDILEAEEEVRPLIAGLGAPKVEAFIEDQSAGSVGFFLVEIDREMRRSIRFLRSPSYYLNRAVSPSRSPALSVVSADPGSLHVVLLPVDEAVRLLLSRPIQLMITLSWFWDRRPNSWGLPRGYNRRAVADIAKDLAQTAREAVRAGNDVEYEMRLSRFGGLSSRLRSSGPRGRRRDVSDRD